MLWCDWRPGVSIITEMRRPGTAQHVASRSWMGSRTFPRGTCSRNRLHPHQAGINSLDCVQTKVHGDATWWHRAPVYGTIAETMINAAKYREERAQRVSRNRGRNSPRLGRSVF